MNEGIYCILSRSLPRLEKGPFMIEAALYDLLNESIRVEKLLTPAQIAEYFERTATFDNRFTRRSITYSFGSGPISCLFYNGKKDDAAATTAGGTGLVSLVNLLQRGSCNFRHMPVTWHFAPSLDLGSNQEISKFRSAIKELKPEIVCAVDNQISVGNTESAKFSLKDQLPEKHVNLIRTMFEKSGIELERQGCDPVMGRGFKLLKPTREALLVEIPRSCQYFRVELQASKEFQPADSTYLLMAAALVAVDSVTAKNV